MKCIISRSINVKILFTLLFDKTCCVEYLAPIENPIYKKIVNYLAALKNIKLKRIKMGKIKSDEGKSLYRLVIEKTNKEIFKKRKLVYENSSYVLLNVLNDLELFHDIWDKRTYHNLLKSYYELRSKVLSEDDFYFRNKWNFNNPSKLHTFLIKARNIFVVETIRILINIIKLPLTLKFNKRIEQKKLIKVNNLILSSEHWPKNNSDKFYRNQYVLSKNLSKGETFVSIDYKNKLIHMKSRSLEIEKGSIHEYLEIISNEIPPINKYFNTQYQLGFKNFLLILKITYHMWSAVKNIKAENYLYNYFSTESASLIILAKIFNSKSYIYQGSLGDIMYPMLHSPYAGAISFTDKNEKLYFAESQFIQGSVMNSKKMQYPFNALKNIPRITSLKSKYESNFDLTIAYFDANYPSERKRKFCYYDYFYEDLKEEIKVLLKFLKKNPKVAILSKSKFISNTKEAHDPFELINKNPELKNLFNPNQFIEFSKKSEYSDRNIVSPMEVSLVSDISIGTTNGGTAPYEAAKSGGRVLLMRSGWSAYEKNISRNVIFNSLEEILSEISKVGANRRDLKNSNLGVFNVENL